ncbi:hypothetical protein RRG08_002518 [Elysia crispata]|uniref:G-protein coupled receptors family 1 profile domain-containing protein n=1 Tax=Elysia crispata TaxID=231223 RepID=A0AAE1A7W7_9GAST|nr:hypothetical protein RRG08_002518 [Elysia crispata]
MNSTDAQAGLMSNFVKDIIICINMVLLDMIALFGLLSNTVNIVVFRKHSFRESITVTLFSTSISDIVSLLFLLPSSMFQLPGFAGLSRAAAAMYRYRQAVGQMRHVSRLISIWITVLITIERCVCIVKPLKVKEIFTPRRSTTAILIISSLLFFPTAVTVSLFFTERCRQHFAFLPDIGSNSTSTGASAETAQTKVYQSIVFGLGAASNFISLLAVTVSIGYLAVMLRKRSSYIHGGNRLLKNPNTASRRTNLLSAKTSAKVHPISTLPNLSPLTSSGPISSSTSQSNASSSIVIKIMPLNTPMNISYTAKDRSHLFSSSFDSDTGRTEPPKFSNEQPRPKSSNEQPRPKSSNEQPRPKFSNEQLRPKSSNKLAPPKSSNGQPQPKSSKEQPQRKFRNEQPRPKSSNEQLQGSGSAAIAASSVRRSWRLGRMMFILSGINLVSFLPAGVCLTIALIEPQFRSGGRLVRRALGLSMSTKTEHRKNVFYCMCACFLSAGD